MFKNTVMRIFYNFFIKIIAFFSAIAVFIVILLLLFSLSKNGHKENGFDFKEGNINSNNKIALLKLKGPILNEPNELIELDFFYNYEIIFVSEVKKILKKLELENIEGKFSVPPYVQIFVKNRSNFFFLSKAFKN